MPDFELYGRFAAEDLDDAIAYLAGHFGKLARELEVEPDEEMRPVEIRLEKKEAIDG